MVTRALSIEKRVEIAERDLRDHAKSLTAHNDAIRLLEQRTTAIEEARRARQMEEIRREEREDARELALVLRLNAIDAAISSVKEDVGKLRGAGSKVAWLIIGAVVLAGAGFILKGGLLL